MRIQLFFHITGRIVCRFRYIMFETPVCKSVPCSDDMNFVLPTCVMCMDLSISGNLPLLQIRR